MCDFGVGEAALVAGAAAEGAADVAVVSGGVSAGAGAGLSAAGGAGLSAAGGAGGLTMVAADGAVIGGGASMGAAGAGGVGAGGIFGSGAGWLGTTIMDGTGFLGTGFSGTTLASTAMSVGMGAYNYTAQSAQSKANSEAAMLDYTRKLETMGLQRGQINAQAADAQFSRGQQAQFALAKMRVAAGEAGVSGNSVNANEREVKFNESQDAASIEINRRAKIVQSYNAQSGVTASTQGTLNKVKSGSPSLVGSGLQIAGSVMDNQSKSYAYKNGVATNQE